MIGRQGFDPEFFGALPDRESRVAAIARGTERMHMPLTEDAWDEIQRADDEELDFLLLLSTFDASRLDVHAALRALFENRVVRRYALGR